MHSLEIRIHVSHRNHYPPTFSKTDYTFYVPMGLKIDNLVVKVEVG